MQPVIFFYVSSLCRYIYVCMWGHDWVWGSGGRAWKGRVGGGLHLALPEVKAQGEIEAWSGLPGWWVGRCEGWSSLYSPPKWTIVNAVCGTWPNDTSTRRHTRTRHIQFVHSYSFPRHFIFPRDLADTTWLTPPSKPTQLPRGRKFHFIKKAKRFHEDVQHSGQQAF